MPKVPNTLRRQGIFYFRRAVPGDLKPLFPFGELVRSLKTAKAADARRLSHCCYLLSEELYAIARSSPPPTAADIARLVQDFYADVLAQENRFRLEGGVLSEQLRLSKARHWAEVAERARKDLASNRLSSARQIALGYLRINGFTDPLSEGELREVEQAFLRAGSELAEALKARFEGDFSFQPRDELLTTELDRSIPSAERQNSDRNTHTERFATTAPASDRALFSQRCDEFRNAQMRRGIWENQTANQARNTYKLFMEFAGDQPLDEYRRSHATAFKNVLLDLPADYGKAPTYRGMAARDIAALVAEATDIKKISPRTVQRHFAAMSALWKDAVDNEEVTTNLFDGFKFRSEKRPQDQRDMWSSLELATLFDSPLYTGCFSASRRARRGDLILRDEKFWLPLIAVFSALRQEEICQLHVDDVREEDGVWVFDICAQEPRKLKNENAVRLVPVHEELKRIGFLTYVEEQRKAKRSLLFNQLTPGGADNRMGHNFSKWFTRYRKDTGQYARGRDFHSFRHSAITFLERGGVQRALLGAIIGHSVPGETSRYSKGYEAKMLKEAIDRLDLKVDLTHLHTSS